MCGSCDSISADLEWPLTELTLDERSVSRLNMRSADATSPAPALWVASLRKAEGHPNGASTAMRNASWLNSRSQLVTMFAALRPREHRVASWIANAGSAKLARAKPVFESCVAQSMPMIRKWLTCSLKLCELRAGSTAKTSMGGREAHAASCAVDCRNAL